MHTWPLGARIIVAWVWLVVGSAVPALIVGLFSGRSIDFAAAYSDRAGWLIGLLVLLTALIPIGDWLTRQDLSRKEP